MMTKNEARQYLSSYVHQMLKIQSMEMRSAELRRLAQGASSQSISDTPGCSGGAKKEMRDYVAEYLDLDRKIMIQRAAAEIVANDITDKIGNVFTHDPTAGNALYFFYANRKHITDIAEEMNYSIPHTKRILAKGVCLFAQVNDGTVVIKGQREVNNK